MGRSPVLSGRELELRDRPLRARLRPRPRHTSGSSPAALSFTKARVARSYRAPAIREGDHWIWFWIGTHADYDRLLSTMQQAHLTLGPPGTAR